MNPFDFSIISILNQYAHRSWTFDTFVYLLAFNPLLKAAPIVTIFWWAWFKEDEGTIRNREILLCGIMGSFLAVGVARILSAVLPFRQRPLHNLALHFQVPYNMKAEHLLGWSSFPSDTAALFFTVATIVLLVSWRAGVFLFFYAGLTAGLARIYLGIHYPTDILAGALIGIGVAWLSKVPRIRTTMTGPAKRWQSKAPGAFYACFFLISFLITDTFNSLIVAGNFIFNTTKAIQELLF